MSLLDPLELTGRARTHVVQLDELRCALHRDVVEPFLGLRAAAAQAGMDIRVFSAFRDFGAQLSIWNRKFSGERTLFSRDGGVLEHASLDDHFVHGADLEDGHFSALIALDPNAPNEIFIGDRKLVRDWS